MQIFKTMRQAYKYFCPYDPSRTSETVTIYNGGEARFLSWNQGKDIFTLDKGNHRVSAFKGRFIDNMNQDIIASAKLAAEGKRLTRVEFEQERAQKEAIRKALAGHKAWIYGDFRGLIQ